MHELSMANSIIETVLNEAKKRNAKSVLEVNLVVGKFAMLGTEQLRYCYGLLVKGTPLEKSKLRIEGEEGGVRCEACNFEGPIHLEQEPEYHIMYPTLQCPKCGGTVEMVAGRNCFIKSVKLRA